VSEVTLGDYAGYLLLEMMRAREAADRYSRSVAERYSQDGIMRFFSVPRFRMPKAELTVPLLVSDARFQEHARFDFPVDAFVVPLSAYVNEVIVFLDPETVERSRVIDDLARALHTALSRNPDPAHPEPIVADLWPQIMNRCLDEVGLREKVELVRGARELIARILRDVVELVRSRTVIDRTVIESLLVDPRTNAVKLASEKGGVFTVKLDVLEDGYFLRSLRDEETGETTTIVELE
jgi:hypothetical protein